MNQARTSNLGRNDRRDAATEMCGSVFRSRNRRPVSRAAAADPDATLAMVRRAREPIEAGPGALGRIATLGWLTLRQRPMSVTGLLAAQIDRRRRPRSIPA